jgi:hypothetical protein
VLSAGQVLGALVLVKAVDVVLRGPAALPGPLWAVALALWMAGGVALLGRREGYAAVVLAGAALVVDAPLELRRQHLVLVVGVALAGWVTRDPGERLLLWRTQLSALYGVAALAKLNEAFLSGSVLAAALVVDPPLPVLVLLGVGLIAAEGLLAVTPWIPRLRVPGTLLAAVLHGLALPLVAGGPSVTLRLVVFGGTAVLLHAASAGLLPPDRTRVRRCATRRS